MTPSHQNGERMFDAKNQLRTRFKHRQRSNLSLSRFCPSAWVCFSVHKCQYSQKAPKNLENLLTKTRSQCEGLEFDPPWLHYFILSVIEI